MEPRRRGGNVGWRHGLAGIGLLLILVVAWGRTAWVSDDAFITFRSVEQLHAGNGPRWNPHERVQAFTHPLWFGLLAAGRAVFLDLFLVSLALSLVCLLAAFVAVWRLYLQTLPTAFAACALAAFLASQALLDYSSSGLESPLVVLLIVLLHAAASRGHLTGAWLATSGLTLCRPDLLVLAAPVAVAITVVSFRAQTRRNRRLGGALATRIALGLLPLALWCAFAISWYGSLLPNTALAKISTGIPWVERATQGLRYLGVSARFDPWTLVLLIAGPAASLFGRSGPTPAPLGASAVTNAGVSVSVNSTAAVWAHRSLAAGALLHLAGVVLGAGDFMAGRFLVPAAAASLLLVIERLRTAVPVLDAVQRRRVSRLALLFAGSGLLLVAPGLLSPTVDARWRYQDWWGVADERGHYYSRLGLIPYFSAGRTVPLSREPRTESGVLLSFSVGREGWAVPLDQVIVDAYGLADPLLARLPARRPWRVGHYLRSIPAGYLETLEGAHGGMVRTNLLVDPDLHRLYDDLLLATQADVLAPGRWGAIARLHSAGPRFTCVDPLCREPVVARQR